MDGRLVCSLGQSQTVLLATVLTVFLTHACTGFSGVCTQDSSSKALSKLWEIVKGGEAWRATVHGVAKNLIRLSD